MPHTADREEDEGGPEADALFIKELQKKEEKLSVTPMFKARVFTTSGRWKHPSVHPQMNG